MGSVDAPLRHTGGFTFKETWYYNVITREESDANEAFWSSWEDNYKNTTSLLQITEGRIRSIPHAITTTTLVNIFLPEIWLFSLQIEVQHT